MRNPRAAAAVLFALGAGAALAVLTRLRTDPTASRRGDAPVEAPRAIPAAALRRVLEDDARWLERRDRGATARAADPVTRSEIAPADPPRHDAPASPDSRPDGGSLVPVPRPDARRESTP